MTPKEKAQDLILKHLRVNHGFNVHIARQCALIAVDMVIECCRQYDELNETFVTQINHWQEVKQELDKL